MTKCKGGRGAHLHWVSIECETNRNTTKSLDAMKTGITPTPLPPEVMAEKENAKDLTSGCKRIHIKAQPTHATFQHNILQHYCAQRTAYSWPPCNNMLQQVGWYWIKFENGQIFVATFLDVAR